MRSCSTSSGGRTGCRAALVLAALALAGCGGSSNSAKPPAAARDAIALRSPAFANGGTIPTRYTCSSVGKSPPLAWSGVPSGVRELALVVFDPDAPGGGFVHWVIFHLPPTLKGLAAGAKPDAAREAENSAGRDAWAPPCPPPGDAPHHYEFSLYALKAPLSLPDGAKASDAIAAIGRSALVRGRLVGRFGR
jgi:Raf kinase inhibitor-like YbhB/YbcL family protein